MVWLWLNESVIKDDLKDKLPLLSMKCMLRVCVSHWKITEAKILQNRIIVLENLKQTDLTH